jgi:hypothetical protein
MEDPSFPTLPDFGIVAVVQARNRAGLHPVFGEHGGRRLAYELGQAGVALEMMILVL